MTAAVVDWLGLSQRPFRERFAWPAAPIWARDRLTGLTTIATLDELAQVVEGLPSLAAEPLEVGFLDLAGFGAWNTRFGQTRGDELMAVLGRSLAEIPDVLAVRIGGDEFTILGRPGASDVVSRMDAWRHAWPTRLADASMPATVAPRIIVGRAGPVPWAICGAGSASGSVPQGRGAHAAPDGRACLARALTVFAG